MVLSILVGARTEELRSLPWSDVDLEAGTMAVSQRPGGRGQDQGLVFASAVGTPLDAHNVLRSFRAITKAAGIGQGLGEPVVDAGGHRLGLKGLEPGLKLLT